MVEEQRKKGQDADGGYGPFGDGSYHLPMVELERRVEALAPPKDTGELALIVSRAPMGRRETPARLRLAREKGLAGDAWQKRRPTNLDKQITLMRVDVARLIANGQSLALFGDNLLVDLDLSVVNLPAGSRLSVGAATLEVTPQPHHGCLKFRQRFGGDALRLTAHRRFRKLRLRGLYAKVVESGKVEVGDAIEVLNRA